MIINLLITTLISCATLAAAEEVIPLERAHAHNDYRHERPLLDALDHGFCSIEADIHLVEGKLLVAHDADEVEPEKTLESLYLNPLKARVEANDGRVYAGGPTVTLLIDIKSDGETTYAALREVLSEYASMLTHFTDTSTEPGAVSVVISGNCPRELILSDPERLAGIDGRLRDLGGTYNQHQMPLISDNWTSHFKWFGREPMSEEDLTRLRGYVRQAHENGQRVRFWGLPVRDLVWPTLYDAGVDLLNADNLGALRDLLLSKR